MRRALNWVPLVTAWVALIVLAEFVSHAAKRSEFKHGFDAGVATVLCAEWSATDDRSGNGSACNDLSPTQRAYAGSVAADVKRHLNSDNSPSR